MGARLEGIIFDDLECPPTRLSRSLYTYTIYWDVEYLKYGVF